MRDCDDQECYYGEPTYDHASNTCEILCDLAKLAMRLCSFCVIRLACTPL